MKVYLGIFDCRWRSVYHLAVDIQNGLAGKGFATVGAVDYSAPSLVEVVGSSSC